MKILAIFLVAAVFAPQIQFSQWSTTPGNHLMIAPGGEEPKLCSDGEGGSYIIWSNFSYEKTRIYLQHVNKYGIKTLATPMIVSDTNDLQTKREIIEDGYGGAIILLAAEKMIDPVAHYTYTKLFVQRVDKNLNKLWGENGVRVSMKQNDQNCYADPKIVSDKKNNAYIFFGDRRDEDFDQKFNLYMQRIRYDGQRMWNDTGITVTTNVATPQWFLLANLTSRIVAWYAQPPGVLVGLDSSGNKIWEETSNIFYFHLCVSKSDSFFVIRQQSQTVQANLFNWAGDSMWNNWMTIGSNEKFSPKSSDIAIVYDTVLVANYNRTYTQAITTKGSLLFPEGFKYTNSVNSYYGNGRIIQGQNGEFLAPYSTLDSISKLYVQKVNLNGDLLWDSSGVLLSDMVIPEIGGVYFYHIATDGQGGAITVGSNEPSNGIYVQQVSRDGKLGDVITFVSKEIPSSTVPTTFEVSEPYPNPFNPSTTISITIRKEDEFTVSTHNVLGKLLNKRKLHLQTGTYNYRWSSETEGTTSSGMYLLSVTDSKKHSIIKKLLLLK